MTVTRLRLFHTALVPLLAAFTMLVGLLITRSAPVFFLLLIPVFVGWARIGVADLNRSASLAKDAHEFHERHTLNAALVSLALLPLLFWVWWSLLCLCFIASWSAFLASVLSQLAAMHLYQTLIVLKFVRSQSIGG